MKIILNIINLQFIILLITNMLPPLLGLLLTIQFNLYEFTIETHIIFSMMAMSGICSSFVLLRFDFYLTYQKCLSSLPYVQSMILMLIVVNIIAISLINFAFQQPMVIIIYNMAFGSALVFLCITVAIRKTHLLQNFLFKILYTMCFIILVYLDFTNDFLLLSQIHLLILICITIPYLLITVKSGFYRFKLKRFYLLLKKNLPSIFTSSITNFNLNIPILLLPGADINNKDIISSLLRIGISALNPLVVALRQMIQIKLTKFKENKEFDLKILNNTLIISSIAMIVNAISFYAFSNHLMPASLVIAIIIAMIARTMSSQVALIYLNQCSEIKLLYTLLCVAVPPWTIIGITNSYEWIILSWGFLIVSTPIVLIYQLKSDPRSGV